MSVYHVPEDIFTTKLSTPNIMDMTGTATWFWGKDITIIPQCHLKFISTSMCSELSEHIVKTNIPTLIGDLRLSQIFIDLDEYVSLLLFTFLDVRYMTDLKSSNWSSFILRYFPHSP